ncbi:MAG: YciI family protein, partial [Spirosomaceae bacterium]|nr:YciI family protein [Spirosomataceae bacterium]
AKKLRENGNLILGGATLNETEEMIGSVMVVEFKNETALQIWLKNDPYVTQGVWKSIEIKPFKVANI